MFEDFFHFGSKRRGAMCNEGSWMMLWMMLTLASALDDDVDTHQRIGKGFSAQAWRDAVLALNAEGVRSHLLDWNVEHGRVGFEAIVDI